MLIEKMMFIFSFHLGYFFQEKQIWQNYPIKNSKDYRDNNCLRIF